MLVVVAALLVATALALQPQSAVNIGQVFDAVPTFPAGHAATVVASGTAALGTSSIASGACASVVTVSASGVASTDTIAITPNASVKAVTGYAPSTAGGLTVTAYPTSGNINLDQCNWSSNSVTPGAVTINWTVTR
jgi:hypothetical protein